MFDKDQTDDVNASRRSLLKGVAAGSVAAAGVGTASAAGEAAGYATMAEKEQFRAQYEDEAVVREAVAEHAGDFLAALADEGLVDSADPADLVTEPRSTKEHLESDRSVTVGAVSAEDGLTAHIDVAYRTDEYDLDVLVQPEAGRTYAFLDDGESVRRIDHDSGNDVTIQDSCGYVEQADNETCSGKYTNDDYKVYQIECCVDAGCHIGPVVDCQNTFPGYVDPCCEACWC